MVLLTRIYTKGGDKGKTSLGSKARVLKSSQIIQAIGDVDEGNAIIGLARLHATEEIDTILARIQNDLFDVGADLCIPDAEKSEASLRISAPYVTALENDLDGFNAALPPLTSFVLPAGTPLAATLHHARTVIRRAERSVCALESVNPEIICYLNRLSDLLFVLARYANHQAEGDVLWRPGNRSQGTGVGKVILAPDS